MFWLSFWLYFDYPLAIAKIIVLTIFLDFSIRAMYLHTNKIKTLCFIHMCIYTACSSTRDYLLTIFRLYFDYPFYILPIFWLSALHIWKATTIVLSLFRVYFFIRAKVYFDYPRDYLFRKPGIIGLSGPTTLQLRTPPESSACIKRIRTLKSSSAWRSWLYGAHTFYFTNRWVPLDRRDLGNPN